MELIISGFPLLVSGLPQPKILLQFARWGTTKLVKPLTWSFMYTSGLEVPSWRLTMWSSVTFTVYLVQNTEQ